MKAYKLAIFSVVLGAAATMGAWAQTSGSLTLRGTIPQILQLTIAPVGSLEALDLTVAIPVTTIATVTEKTNRRTGYNVTIKSSSAEAAGTAGPVFKGLDTSNTETLPYILTYGGNALTFTAGIATIIGPAAKTTSAGTEKTVTMEYILSGLFPNADTYQDILTFTIIGK